MRASSTRPSRPPATSSRASPMCMMAGIVSEWSTRPEAIKNRRPTATAKSSTSFAPTRRSTIPSSRPSFISSSPASPPQPLPDRAPVTLTFSEGPDPAPITNCVQNHRAIPSICGRRLTGLQVCSPPRSFLPLHILLQGSRGFYVRAYRALLPPHAPDMLTVRIQVIDGTGTFTLSDSQPCRLLTLLHGHYSASSLLRARPTPENIQRQVTIGFVVAMEEAPFLLTMQRIIRGVEVERDLSRCRPMR